MNKHKLNHLLKLTLLSFIIFFNSCKNETFQADTVFYNGIIYTVDSAFSMASAFAVKEGKIIAIGSDAEILQYSTHNKTDLKGKFVYPGFQDAHCHLYGYGTDLKKISLTGTSSFNAVLDTIKKYENQLSGGWLFGRGWDQNDWQPQVYPDKSKLDSLFPSKPVFLLRIDGHAALVNQTGLDLAGITNATTISGGFIEKKNGILTGLLIDNAVDLVYSLIPPPSVEEQREALLHAQADCFKVGLTSVTDAGIESKGLKWNIINLIDSLQKTNQMQMRINAMASIEDFEFYKSKGKIKTNSLNVRSFKVYCDGALGSRGACLLQPYKDQPGHYGFMIHSYGYLDSIAGKIASIGFQMNAHCIGDSANRVMLRIYEKHIKGNQESRWRIEHAQVVNPEDYGYFKRNHIIPSMQPVHATSDMYWAEERLGSERMSGAYALKDLLKQSGYIAAGSDFPVEHINPLYGFYAAVARKDQSGYPPSGFRKSNGLSRKEALRSMTIWAAYAAFMEDETGSLEPGKFADFVILEDDIMKTTEEKLWQTNVLSTYINGTRVYQRGE